MAEYVEVIDNAAIHRFELPVGDEVAAAYYAIEDGGIVFTHTEVPFVFSAQGYGSKLTRSAFQSGTFARDARDRQMPVDGRVPAQAS